MAGNQKAGKSSRFPGEFHNPSERQPAGSYVMDSEDNDLKASKLLTKAKGDADGCEQKV